MNVLILTNNDIGLYNFRKELICGFLEENKVCISLPKGDKVSLLEDMGCKFIETNIDRRGINPITDFKLLCKYFKIIKDVKPDLVITYTIKPNIYGGLVCRLMKIPYFCNITGLGTAFQNDNWLKKVTVMLYKIALKKVKTVFFENAENKNIFVKNNIIQETKTHVLNGAGVNLNDFPFAEYPSAEKIRFLFIGRVMKEKGIEEFCTSAEKIKKEYHNTEFDIVGPMEDDYKQYIEEYEKNGIVNYYGLQNDVKPFIENAHCFVLPSYHEGMANTLLECGAMGRPLITSNIHGCLEAVLDGKTGFLCKVKSCDDLYEKIKSFIDLPYEIKKQMGIDSNIYVSQRFDKKLVVEDTIGVIEECMKAIK